MCTCTASQPSSNRHRQLELLTVLHSSRGGHASVRIESNQQALGSAPPVGRSWRLQCLRTGPSVRPTAAAPPKAAARAAAAAAAAAAAVAATAAGLWELASLNAAPVAGMSAPKPLQGRTARYPRPCTPAGSHMMSAVMGGGSCRWCNWHSSRCSKLAIAPHACNCSWHQ
jgi:hypothetical protein